MAIATSKPVRLCVIEEQEIYREMYQSLKSRSGIELLQVSGDGRDIMGNMVASLCPDVLLFSTRTLDGGIVSNLEQVRATYSRLAFVILMASCSTREMEMLRRLVSTGRGGVALFLKPSLDSVEQLCNVIMAASHGQIVLDPSFNPLLSMNAADFPFLRQLTPRETEILRLVSKGYTNTSIAKVLYVDLKTVEHHINNLYSKLKSAVDFGAGHPRVNAARLYLEATGELVPVAASQA